MFHFLNDFLSTSLIIWQMEAETNKKRTCRDCGWCTADKSMYDKCKVFALGPQVSHFVWENCRLHHKLLAINILATIWQGEALVNSDQTRDGHCSSARPTNAHLCSLRKRHFSIAVIRRKDDCLSMWAIRPGRGDRMATTMNAITRWAATRVWPLTLPTSDRYATSDLLAFDVRHNWHCLRRSLNDIQSCPLSAQPSMGTSWLIIEPERALYRSGCPRTDHLPSTRSRWLRNLIATLNCSNCQPTYVWLVYGKLPMYFVALREFIRRVMDCKHCAMCCRVRVVSRVGDTGGGVCHQR